MKKLLLLFVGLCATFTIFAKQVELQRAQKVAASFLSTQSETKSVSVFDLIPVEISLPGANRISMLKSIASSDKHLVYLFKSQSEGFVLVAGDDLARPILGYSDKSEIDGENLPVNMLKWIEEYKRQIRFLKKSDLYKSSQANSDWQKLENNQKLEDVSVTVVNALMTTTWSQSPYYNDLCPQKYWFSDKAVTGCVATAMAQIMKYHNYPEKGEGIHSYYHSNESVTYGNLTANFGATTYDWDNMPNELTSSSTTTQINAVATLMLHCGVSIDMNYSPESSGAYVIEDKSYDGTSAESALKEYFGYHNAYGVERSGMSTTEWISLLKNELDNNRPILFAGFGGGSGHAFVADGYSPLSG